MTLAQQLPAVTDASFEKEVLRSREPVVVVFHAAWSNASALMEPTLPALLERTRVLGGRVMGLAVDRQPQTPSAYGVETLPTIMLFVGGMLVEKLIGVSPTPELLDALEEALRG